MENHPTVLKGNGWDNHEDSFEETLRREMLHYKGLYHLIQEDMTQLSETHNKSLERIKELLETNESLRARLDKDDRLLKSLHDSSKTSNENHYEL
tara:strand:+ start:1941 stop:2225 length:285 start_codon:yes stop_codon:yes gene_type:complete